MKQIVLVIPAYEPDNRLLALLTDLKENKIGPVVLVNDGSGLEYQEIFIKASELIEEEGGILLVHKKNRGKGRALKTAFNYILSNFSDAIGVVTADSDGQHTVEAIEKVKEELLGAPENLILGVRNFHDNGIPWKSRLGNNLTEKVFRYLSGVHVSDTQTGLRGVPRNFMQQLLEVKGEPLEGVNKIAKTIENKGFSRKGKADGKNFVRWKPLHILERCKEKRQGKAAVRHGLGIVFKL